MEANNKRRIGGLKDKIPDIQKTLETVRFLQKRDVSVVVVCGAVVTSLGERRRRRRRRNKKPQKRRKRETHTRTLLTHHPPPFTRKTPNPSKQHSNSTTPSSPKPTFITPKKSTYGLA